MLLLITGMICLCERVGLGSVAGFGMVVCLAGYLMGQKEEGSLYRTVYIVFCFRLHCF
jgi:hypothetical protein